MNDEGPKSAARVRSRAKRSLPVVIVLALGFGLVACDDINSVRRSEEPVVLTGADLPALLGASPDQIVAFKHGRPDNVGTWFQVPVQIDQRKIVDFGQAASSNTTAGTTGTVYGTAPIGVTSLQYADPNTFVGADPDPTFDADDELVFMSTDAGGKPRPDDQVEPAGVVPGSGVQVLVEDPIDEGRRGWLYLFRSAGSLEPSAGADYVDYDFNLTSGNYKTTYKRADGPNPETSMVTTPNYRIGFTDRWIENQWRIDAGDATGVDVLDGVKARFGLTTCARSNATFADGEGAFIANIDGPVRAIRSYVGANSGPLTQRTHIFYRDRAETVTNLRVHAIPGIMDYVDYSLDASGMTYRNSVHQGGVTIDGAADNISTAVADWELVTGDQGSVLVAGRVTSSAFPPGASLDAVADGFYRDERNSTVDQCWGDPHFLGASGLSFPAIPNTDPAQGAFATFDATRVVRFAPPGMTTDDAAAWSAAIAAPLVTTATAYG